MRIAVIGGGYWGSKHVRVLSGLGTVDQLVLVDPRDSIRSSMASAYPGLETHGQLDAVLPTLDAVVVATPPTSHADLALRALSAGCHVLVEKPMATSTADARSMQRLADELGLVLMCGHTFEYHSAVWRLREAVASGELGELHYIDTARLNLGLYQPDVNVIWDLAPHDVSIINHVLDATPDVVTAWGNAHAHAYLEDVAYLRLEYHRAGVEAQIHVSWLDPRKVRRVTVVGSRRMAVYNDLAEDERVRIYDKGVETPDGAPVNGNGVSYRNDGVTAPALAFEEPLVVQDRHFLDCVRHGLRPSTAADNGAAVVEVLEAAEISLRRNGPVVLDQLEFAEAGAA
jgi:predicted dehydrogenase